MSLNVKLVAIGLLLAAIAIGVTLKTQILQLGARQAVWQVFDNVSGPLAALQSAQGRVALLEERFVRTPGNGEPLALPPAEAADLVGQLSDILSKLGQTESVLQPGGESAAAVGELRFAVSRLKATQGDVSRRMVMRELGDIAARFDGAVAALRADAYDQRRTAGEAVTGAMEVATLGLVALLAVGVVLFALFARTLGRSIAAAAAALEALDGLSGDGTARAGRIADLRQAIADLGNRRAAERRRAESELASRTGVMEREIAVQRTRFETAIENMSQGFGLLDEKRVLIAANATFRRLFPHLKPGIGAAELASDPHIGPLFGPSAETVAASEIADGETIEIRRLGSAGGTTTITVENVTERRAASRRIEELSGCDGLTGLPNRARFHERLEAALRKDNVRAELAVLFVEVEGYKSLVASLGHAASDALLKVTAERLAGALREGDFLARVGGDEFAILRHVPRAGESGERLAQRILASFEEPVSTGERFVETGVSIGIVPLTPRGARSPLDLEGVMQDGEVALSQTRRDEARYRIFAPDMRHAINERRELEGDLRIALGAGQLELFYQPIVDVSAGRVSGFEALMRWRHPVRGMVPPSIFIALAEELGLIEEIGLFALQSACAQAVGWPQDVTVSVNLSPLQFRSPTLVSDVAGILKRTGLPPKRLQLEVTETLFLDRGERTLADLSALRALGPTISMDDFGTGYSSLGYLSRFPFDKIKIDQSFVRDMEKPESAAIVRAVIGLSSAMNMAVLAEGVETPEQYRRLRAEGCREMQGYLFSRPRPASDLVRMMVQINEQLASSAFDIRPAVA